MADVNWTLEVTCRRCLSTTTIDNGCRASRKRRLRTMAIAPNMRWPRLTQR
ncbi:hypothetical protein BHE74_00019209, partial [Ensete ventricosum]